MNKRICFILVIFVSFMFLPACRTSNNQKIDISEETVSEEPVSEESTCEEPVREAVYVEVESASGRNESEEVNPYQEYYNFVLNYNSYEWEKTYPDVDYGWDSFQLVELDGDDYPELVATNADSRTRVDGGMQCYLIVDYHENSLVINEIADGVASAGGYRGEKYFIPEKGILYDRAMWAPYGTPGDTVYIMEDGKVKEKDYGYFEPDSDYEYPDNMEKGIWYWNEEVVTEEEYNNKLNDATNNLSGKAFCEINYLDKDSMTSELFELYNNPLKRETKYEPLYEFVGENISLMGTIIFPPVEYDVTGDGHDDYCATVVTGSGIISSLIAVFDVQNKKGYLLNERMTYDYRIEGIEDGALVVNRSEWGKEKEVKGHLLFEEDALIFAEIIE